MDKIIAAIAEKAGIEPTQAESALGIILTFLHEEGPTETVEALADKLGVASLIGGEPKTAGGGLFGGGLMGAVGSLLGGGQGGALAALGTLQGLGLGMDQIKSVASEIMAVARRELGEEKTKALIAAIPGLSGIL